MGINLKSQFRPLQAVERLVLGGHRSRSCGPAGDPGCMPWCIVGGLIPIMWSSGAGASVMKRIAAPMIGGMVSATVLTLLVIPVAYELLERRKLRR